MPAPGSGWSSRATRPGVRSLADLRGKRVGIVAGTVALAEKDHAVARFKTARGAARRVRGREARRRLPRRRLRRLVPARAPEARACGSSTSYVPRERWNMALAVRAGDARAPGRDQPGAGPARRVGRAAEGLRRLRRAVPSPVHGDRPPGRGAADTWRRIRDRGELVVSMDPANLPYSAAKDDRPGFDVELARALADRLHVKLRIEWLDIHRETAVGELIQGRCDLVFGEAVDPNAVADDEPLAGKILYSRPYYGTGYVLVRRKDGPRVGSLAELKGRASQRLGTEAGSVADYRLRQRGYLRRLYRNQLAALKALADGDIDFAYLWANVGWTLHASPDFAAKLEIVPGFEPEDRWNIAVAMRRGDDELKRQVDAALGALIADGTVARALARYHVPSRSRPRAAGAIRRAPTGPEPDMRKVQTSQASVSTRWPGSARPASWWSAWTRTTCRSRRPTPRPAGLDYEIAGLLAEQLGVSLRVYWAYLGARLVPLEAGDQAALRRDPGRHARRSVRAAGALFPAVLCRAVSRGRPIGRRAGPSASEPMAVEEGVAVRGLEGARGPRLSQHRGGPGGRGDGPGAGGLRDRDPRAPGWPTSAGRASWSSCPRRPSRDRRVPDRRGGAQDGPRPEGRDRPGLGRARPLGPARPVFARWHIPYEPAGERCATADRGRRQVREPDRRRRPGGDGRSLVARGDRRRAGPAAVVLAARPAPAAGSRRSAGPGGPPPPDPAALAEGQALFRGLCSGCHGGRRPRRQGPRPDRRQVAPRRHRRRHRPHDPERRAQDHHEEAGRRRSRPTRSAS